MRVKKCAYWRVKKWGRICIGRKMAYCQIKKSLEKSVRTGLKRKKCILVWKEKGVNIGKLTKCAFCLAKKVCTLVYKEKVCTGLCEEFFSLFFQGYKKTMYSLICKE